MANKPKLAIDEKTRKKFFEIDDYELMDNAYKGSGGFKNGEYLVPHPRETVDKFERRKSMAYYLNYVKTVVDSHVNPIFRKTPVRTWGANNEGGPTPLLDQFTNDADTNKTTIERFMKRAAKEAKRQGVVFIVVDNYAQQPDRQQDAIRDRILPYAYLVSKNHVTNYTTDGAGKITSITYEEIAETSNGNPGKIVVWEWTKDTWKKSGTDISGGGPNQIGRIPVVPLFAADAEPGNLKPDCEFYSIARTNAALFNLCSWLDEILQNQGFAILTYPVGSAQQPEEIQEIIVGTENVLGYDGTLSNSPEFKSPPGEMASALQAQIDRMIKEIYRMAILSHVTGVQDAKSGVAKAWDFETTNMVLSDFAQNCEQAEQQVIDLVDAYTGEDSQYSAEYSRDFGIDDVLGALEQIQAGKDLGVGGKFDKELHKKAAKVMFNDIPDDDFDEVIADIDARAEEAETQPVMPITKADQATDVNTGNPFEKKSDKAKGAKQIRTNLQ